MLILYFTTYHHQSLTSWTKLSYHPYPRFWKATASDVTANEPSCYHPLFFLLILMKLFCRFFFLNNILFCFPNNLRMIFLCFFLPWFHNWHLAHAFFVHNSLDHLVGGTALQPSRGISRSGNCRPTVSLRKCLRRLPEAQFPVQYSFYASCSTFAHWLQNDQCLLVDAEYTYLTGDDDVIVIWSIRNVLLIATMWIIVIFS